MLGVSNFGQLPLPFLQRTIEKNDHNNTCEKATITCCFFTKTKVQGLIGVEVSAKGRAAANWGEHTTAAGSE